MNQWLAGALAFVLGGAYWLAANQAYSVAEPWDSSGFLGLYTLAVAISFVLGFGMNKASPMIGMAFVLAMLPVMLIQSGIGPLIAVGLLFLGVLSVPAAMASQVGGKTRLRLRGN